MVGLVVVGLVLLSLLLCSCWVRYCCCSPDSILHHPRHHKVVGNYSLIIYNHAVTRTLESEL